MCFRSQITTESERYFFGSRFSVALLHNLADLAEKPEHANAPNVLPTSNCINVTVAKLSVPQLLLPIHGEMVHIY